MGNFDIINRIEIHRPYSNLDKYYGPYTGLVEANSMVPFKIRQRGLTVGIIENGAVVEYWWSNGITDNDLVPKSGVVNNQISNEIIARATEDAILHALITGETANRISGDTSLSDQISSEISKRINNDNILYNLITAETVTRANETNDLGVQISTGYTNLHNLVTTENAAIRNQITAETATRIETLKNYVSYTGSTNDVDLGQYSLSTQSSLTAMEFIKSGGTSSQFLKADGSIDNTDYSIVGHEHHALYTPNGLSKIAYVDAGGALHIDGDIYQSGVTYDTHAEKVYTNNDYIILREGATTSLANGQYAGFEAIKYDGTNNGRLVFDNTGTARVGDVGSEQPLATRSEVGDMTDGGMVYWSAADSKIITDPAKDQTLFNLISDETSDRITGDTALSNQITAETANRAAADNVLNNQISNLNEFVFESTIPIYDDVSKIPSSGDTTSPENVLVVSSEAPLFNEDQEKAMMLEAIYALQKEVSLIKRSFTDHMNGGDFENDKLIIAGNDPTVEAEEPLWASETGIPLTPTSGTTFEDLKPSDPNILKITHFTVKSGKFEDLPIVMNYLLPDEMVWVYDRKRMYIKQRDGSLFWLNSAGGDSEISGTTGTTGNTNNTGNTINMDNIESITFISPNSNKYLFRINNNGEPEIINQKTEIPPDPNSVLETGPFSGLTESLYLPKLYINSIYCGGLDSEFPAPAKYQPCSHNFVELSNLTGSDIGLQGISLRYSINGSVWETLHLQGMIKAGSTYLIRGAQCSIMEANTTIIKVNSYDMEWRNTSDELMQFSNIKAKFLLEYTGTGDTSEIVNPYRQDSTTKAYCSLGYIDMVGLNKTGATTPEKIDGYEQARFEQLVPASRMYMKYYQMDHVTQATKAIGARSNSADWTWIELNKNLQPNIELYTPKASFEGKDIFFDKTKLDSLKPNMVTVTFGINAHTTRCFNWISTGYYDEYLWYRVSGETSWTQVESFKEGDGRASYTNKYYNRIRVVATDGTPYTAHKLIITGLEPGVYEYKCGRTSHESDVAYFKVTAYSAGGFSFIQTSDQQGFNWCEYEVWRKAADFIKDNENPTFTLNTGDMAQNGNRINEWLDYYNAGKSLFNGTNTTAGDPFNGVEQMNVVGNNDLSPKDYELLGNGSDLSKINSINFLFFYTYEMDETNLPIMEASGNTYYIPSLYSFDYNDCHFLMVNSEISENTETYIYDDLDVYAFMKTWCENDLTKNTKKWTIAACHEMPFTIITDALITDYLANNSVVRGGSRINTVVKTGEPYWFSRLLEQYNVRLCIGGHKHTYSESYPIRENYVTNVTGNTYYSMKPIIQVLDSVYNFVDVSGNTPYKTIFDEKAGTGLCELEIVTGITAPKYVMCQSTGYKQTSNKELPAVNIPWLENYFPSTNSSGTPVANPGQKYPFYIKWTIGTDTIVGDVVKINNIMTSGKFNINAQNAAPLAKLNGNGGSNSQIIINYE